ncbi:HORMA domain-containing protein 1-like [Lineus longissimus]|uniref:HORMA domain-containing protein 1-like n=1 Tax=Lineus longissimus TaxID=88925 RepID=UPI002B4EAB6C
MATATCTRPLEKVGTWSNIFPTEQVTETQSCLFVKKLLAVAVSNVTYLRAIFPEHAFGDRCLEDLNLKILRDDSTCPGACQVIKWVKGCFDALDKKFLRMLIIGIYLDPEDPDTVIESYTFKFSFNNEGIDIYRNNKKISSAHSAAETKKATIRLLRTIVVLTQTLKSLPDDVMMTMKLLYYDDITPEDYEPPGFQSADSDYFTFEDEPMNIRVGDVSTPFHTVKLRIKTDSKQFELKEDDEEAEQLINDMAFDQDDSMAQDERDRYPSSAKQPETCDDIPETMMSPAKPSPGVDTTGSESQRSQVDDGEEQGVCCPCGCNEDDGLMVLCAICKYWQHGVCFKVLCEAEAPETHICDSCAVKEEMKCTDPYLTGKSPVVIQGTCLWRRAILACTEISRIVVVNFARRLGVEMTVASGLIHRLEKEGFLKVPGKGKRLGKVVQTEKLQAGIKKYFGKSLNDTSAPEGQEAVVDEELVNPINAQIQEQLTQTSSQPSQPVDEIEKLASKTESINLSGRRKKGKKQNMVDKPQEMEQGETVQVEIVEKEMVKTTEIEKPNKLRGRKRAVSQVDQSHEFDVSDSQEQEVRPKRRRSSIATKPIMV